jgi:uncharacterized protein YbjT (DUF2867 family)
MKVAVVGGGVSGAAIRRALVDRGASVEMLSRSTGFDVLRDDAAGRLREADVVVEATGRFTTSARVATDFFIGSTRAIAEATRATGAMHLLLSIVNCDLPEVQGYGYFAGKTAQERVAHELSPHLTIVKTTQWFEFAGQTRDRLGFGPIGVVPRMLIQPVALDSVADIVADFAIGRRSGNEQQIAGPEKMTLLDMTQRIQPTRPIRVPLVLPGPTWRAINRGALLPEPGAAELVGPTFSEWLAQPAV